MPVTIPFPSKASLKFWKKRSADITEYDPTFKVVYLGNIITSYAKGEGCTEKPLSTLWKAYTANPAVQTAMELTICSSGIKAVTKAFGVTEYWAYRITHCAAPADFPGVFCWIYRHERPKMKQELRCHAALCVKVENARELTTTLKDRLALALQEFRREKLNRQKARLSLANAVYDCPSMPHRKLLLVRGSINFRPPIEMSRIAPKLGVIDEDDLEEEFDIEFGTPPSAEDLFLSSSEGSSYSCSPEEDLFARFRRLRTRVDSECGSDCSEEDLFFEEASSRGSISSEEGIPLIDS